MIRRNLRTIPSVCERWLCTKAFDQYSLFFLTWLPFWMRVPSKLTRDGSKVVREILDQDGWKPDGGFIEGSSPLAESGLALASQVRFGVDSSSEPSLLAYVYKYWPALTKYPIRFSSTLSPILSRLRTLVPMHFFKTLSFIAVITSAALAVPAPTLDTNEHLKRGDLCLSVTINAVQTSMDTMCKALGK